MPGGGAKMNIITCHLSDSSKPGRAADLTSKKVVAQGARREGAIIKNGHFLECPLPSSVHIVGNDTLHPISQDTSQLIIQF
uniref:Uncharacterized protein n=1 Tax=Pyxicephalus adspersus TaxID=30357 RepID=A0AAV2ZTH5_PYXAD|nr:TPA: hypothetical protein GDO54_018308 [Pyxicephalus adspersus]